MSVLICLAHKLKARLCVFVLLACVLSGCATQDEALIPAELAVFESSARIKTLWHAPLDANARIAGIGPFKSGRVYSRPIFGGGNYARFYLALHNETIFAATERGRVFAVNKNTGKRIWRANVKRALSAGVSFNAGRLFVATLEGEVLALSAETGETIWTAQVSTEVVTPPQSNGREVLVTAIDGRLFALNAETGEQLWNYDHPQPLLTFRSQASPLVLNNQAFVGFDNGQLLSFGTREGDLRWAVRVSQPQGITELERAVDLDVTPVANGPFIYAAGANGRIAAISKGTGKISWAEDASVFNELAFNTSALFYVDEESHVFARQATTGRQLWESNALHRRGVGSPSVVGDYLVMIDNANILHVIDVASGKLAARHALLGNGYSAPILVDDNTAYLFSSNGTLSAYRVSPKN